MSESFLKKEIGLRALFLFFYNKLKHPHVKCSLLFLIVLTCNFQASSNKTTQLPESYVTSHKHNVILILF